MKNPNWQRDELILALNLYFKLDRKNIDKRNPQITELSELLNRLPIFGRSEQSKTFRNPDGVSLKMSNFLAIDPEYLGKGMERHGKLDHKIFHEFKDNRPLLSQLANSITRIANDQELNHSLTLEEDFDDIVHTALEGAVLYKLHKHRERNQGLVGKKKKSHYKKHGNLACEKCSFDFEKTYGTVGRGFIECHHKTPLAELSISRVTSLDDLMLVCSNCHRMLHRGLTLYWK